MALIFGGIVLLYSFITDDGQNWQQVCTIMVILGLIEYFVKRKETQ
jgi:hypothetical protein